MATGNVVGALAAGAWFTRGTWKQTVVDEGEEDEPGEGDDRPATPKGS